MSRTLIIALTSSLVLGCAGGAANVETKPGKGSATETWNQKFEPPPSRPPIGKPRNRRVATGTDTPAARCRRLLPWIQQAAKEYDLDTALLVGTVRVESNFRPEARSSAGAIGLMQVMPQTAKANGCGNLWNPLENLRCGARVLKRFLARYGNNLLLGLSAYHAGYLFASEAEKNSTLPQNISYVERVLSARSRFLYYGCDSF